MRYRSHLEAGASRSCRTGGYEPESPRAKASARYLPIIFFQLYLTGSLVAFGLGPLQPEVPDWPLLISYALVGQLVILFGYHLGVLWRPRAYSGRLPRRFLACAAIVVTLVLLPATLSSRNYADVSVKEAILNPGEVYLAVTANYRSPSGVRALSVVRAVLGPVMGLLIPLGIVFWRQLPTRWRALWLAALAGRVCVAFISGAAFHLFDIVLLVPWFLWLQQEWPKRRAESGVGERIHGYSLRKNRVLIGFASLVVVWVGLWYFGHSRLSRFQRDWSDGYPSRAVGWSEDLYGVSLPEPAEFGIYFVTRYWSLGYQGLSGSLHLPFEWTRGMGHSIFISRYVARLDPELKWVEESTYPARLENSSGYRADLYWHTVYPWLASDLTFAGALVFMGVVGFLLAAVWSDALRDRNPFALGFLGQLLLFFYYIPANNTRLGNPEAAVTLWGLLALWLITRERIDAGS